jgi:hypothetical protein
MYYVLYALRPCYGFLKHVQNSVTSLKSFNWIVPTYKWKVHSEKIKISFIVKFRSFPDLTVNFEVYVNKGSMKLLNQVFLVAKFYGHHYDFVYRYGVSVSQMTTDMFDEGYFRNASCALNVLAVVLLLLQTQ